ncbi:MAG: dihydroxyacetone kinase subunit L [Lachnospiraceae bacterium]|nr:dihydroxyacetone kinase subunit L [Lachnospiraceae bacterium]MCI9135737.1 dihydroxyacetone kinase subunit L [Lachnospiraceae bacterium]
MIMEKAGSRPGEKTILDSLYPAVEVLLRESQGEPRAAFRMAAEAAAQGLACTREMKSVHGRAACYGDNRIGQLDGDAAVLSLLTYESQSRWEP